MPDASGQTELKLFVFQNIIGHRGDGVSLCYDGRKNISSIRYM